MIRPLALVSFAVLLLWSRAATAKPKVALTQIDGDASGDVHDAVAEALAGNELSLIGSKEVNRAVDKLGDLADLTEKDFKKLATELEADAIIAGKLDRSASPKTLKFRLYIHKKMAKGFTVSFKDAKSEKFRSMLHDKLLEKIGATSDAADDDKPAKKKKVAAAADDDDAVATRKDGKKKPGKKAKADDDDTAKPGKKAKAAAADDEDTRPNKKKTAAADDEDARPNKKKPAAAADDEDARPAKKAKPADDDAAGDDDAKSARGADDDAGAPRKAKKKVALADDSEGIDASASPGPEAGRAANWAAARVDVGVSMAKRNFAFTAENLPGGPKNTAFPMVPGARLDAEIYPLVLTGSTGVLANVGVGVEYDKTIKLNLKSTSMPGTVVPINQSEYAVGLRYRMGFGKTAMSSTLTLGVGYGKRVFSPDRSKLTDAQATADVQRDAPTSEYTVIDPGLVFRYPLSGKLALSLGARGLVITSAGSIQTSASYGRAMVYGAEAVAGLDYLLGSRFVVRLAGEFTQVGFAFKSVGALSNGSTGGPKVGGLTDRSIGGTATLGVVY